MIHDLSFQRMLLNDIFALQWEFVMQKNKKLMVLTTRKTVFAFMLIWD